MDQMKNKLMVAFSVLLLSVAAQAQDKFYTKTGKIDFYSKAPLEDIAARNKSAVSVLDTKTGALQFSVLIKGFEFENAEMQEHFNDNYLESHKFPKAEFKGQVLNNHEINYTKPGTYTAKVKGQLTIHGVTKDVQTTGTFKVDGTNIKAASVFNVAVADYGIKVAPIVRDKIAKTVKITVDTNLEPFKG
jgi:opacity protein-like surface antigen